MAIIALMSPLALSSREVAVSILAIPSSRLLRQMLSLSLMILLTITAEFGSAASCLRVVLTESARLLDWVMMSAL